MSDSTDLNQLTRRWLQSLLDSGVTDSPARTHRQLTGFRLERTIREKESPIPAAFPLEGRESPTVPADCTARSEPTTGGDAPPTLETPSRHLPAAASPWGPSREPTERVQQLARLQQTVAACTRCSELSRCRTQTVFGVGPVRPRLCFFGEGPGADEDRLGEPFVGRAGELLNRIIVACRMRREDVYILNTVKCRPPGNRNPLDEEVANCREYFEQQLEILQPDFICALGAVAARALLDSRDSISRMRGRFYRWRGSQVIVTYHPAYLLRTPEAKAKTWEDMKMLMKAMGVDL